MLFDALARAMALLPVLSFAWLVLNFNVAVCAQPTVRYLNCTSGATVDWNVAANWRNGLPEQGDVGSIDGDHSLLSCNIADPRLAR
jgi:hypothetical protein